MAAGRAGRTSSIFIHEALEMGKAPGTAVCGPKLGVTE
jgi:hypothetical protein